jgi:arsenical pump membrane protein
VAAPEDRGRRAARLRIGLAIAGALALAVSFALAGDHAQAAAQQAWPPFVLVAGLLLVGLVAHVDGLFDAAAARLVALPGPPFELLLACYGLVAVVTALLNLDTAAVFLTPILIATARRRGCDPLPFLYGAVFMANASSLFLPGSNLTNLLVLSQVPVSGAVFAVRMLPAAVASALVTAAGLLVINNRRLAVAGQAPLGPRTAQFHFGAGLAGALMAGIAMVVLRNAALVVLGVGLLAVALRLRGGRLDLRRTFGHVNMPVLVGLFGIAVGLGALARTWSEPSHLMHTSGPWATAAIAAGLSALVNNLPAAVLLSGGHPAHARALLVGLNIGPNLAITGALSALLWLQAARAAGSSPTLRGFMRQGPPLAVAGVAASLAVSGLFGTPPL